MEELKCPICGEPLHKYYNYRKDKLCTRHGKMADNGEIKLCKNCGKWNRADEVCECKRNEQTKSEDTESKLTCIICGEPSNGKHFCVKCYKKYSKMVVFLRVKECKIFDKLGTEYQSDLVCKDGHIVKSHAERDIDNWLFDENIKHVYEPSYPIDNIPEHDLHPDWCLPNYIEGEKVYIEYWGMEGTPKYDYIKTIKMPHYIKDKITLVCINGYADIKNVNATMSRKIGKKTNIILHTINDEK